MATWPQRLLYAIQNSSTTVTRQRGRSSREACQGAVNEGREKEQAEAEAEAPIINPGGFGNRLMITQGNGIPPQAPPLIMVNGTGMPMMPMQTGIPSVSFIEHLCTY